MRSVHVCTKAVLRELHGRLEADVQAALARLSQSDDDAAASDATMMGTTAFDKTSLSTHVSKGEIFVSHIWEKPETWDQFFPTTSYEEVKHLQVDSAMKRQAVTRLGDSGRFRELRIWVDRAASVSTRLEAFFVRDPVFHPRLNPLRACLHLPRTCLNPSGACLSPFPSGHPYCQRKTL